jgi:hypothetical protein
VMRAKKNWLMVTYMAKAVTSIDPYSEFSDASLNSESQM